MVAKEELDSKNTANTKSVLLNNIKNNFFEKLDNKIVLTLYVKNVNKEDAKIEFTETNISITFKTNDLNFLKQHNTEDTSTQFKWDIQLENRINPSSSSFKIQNTTIDFYLSKHESSKNTKWLNVIKPQNVSIVSKKEENETSNETTPIVSKVTNETTRKQATRERAAHSRSASSSSSTSPSFSNRETKPNSNTAQPMRSSYYGYVGLVNLGNTCYMNAALQCLINSTDLRDYFLDAKQDFKKDLNTSNALGLKGRMAVSFAMLVRQLWTSNTNCIAPNHLRDLICSKYHHFRGYEQQDTHEFLCSLMSILHEDLNRVLKKPFYESALECEDESSSKILKIAEESWQRFLSRENSIVVDNFYGQFKSKLTCPECCRISITFEPFNSILVPVPSPKMTIKLILMFHSTRQRQPVKLNLFLSENETVKTLIDEIKNKFSELKNSTLSAFLITNKKEEKEPDLETTDYGYEFDLNWSNISPTNRIPHVDSFKHLMIYETDISNDSKEPSVELKVQQVCKYPLVNNSLEKCSFCSKSGQIDPKTSVSNLHRCSRCFKAAYCNDECQRNDWKQHSENECFMDNVGIPFVITLRKSQLNNSEQFIKKTLLQMSSFSLNVDNFEENTEKLFDLELHDNKKFKLTNLIDLHDLINTNLTNNKSLQLKIQLKWINNKRSKVKTNLIKINELSFSCNESATLNLDDCLKLFMQSEKLTSENPWYCSKCKKHQEATKQMNLCKLPKNLIITLKRFQATKASDNLSSSFMNSSFSYFLQNRVVYNKLNTFIDFPIRNLDMSKYITHLSESNTSSQYNYDLYGVINHLGQSSYLGHYTAFARTHDKLDISKDELTWRQFDDSHVSAIKNEDQIVTKNAYVLFYRLKDSMNEPIKEQEKESLKTEVSITSEDDVLNSDESEQFNSANQSSDDNFDSDDKSPTNYTNLNDMD